jgi:hypothetical protein
MEFQQIAEMNGAGTSSNNHEYSFADRDAKATAYYRLSQVDFDGSRAYLKTIFATTCKTGNDIYAHQFNSNSSELEIFYNTDPIETVQILLIDATGVIIHNEEKRLSPEIQSTSVVVKSQLQPGIYMVYVKTDSETYQGKIVLAE